MLLKALLQKQNRPFKCPQKKTAATLPLPTKVVPRATYKQEGKQNKNQAATKALNKSHFHHKSHSSSSSSECCSETLDLLGQINETTQADLEIDQEILDILQTQCINYIRHVSYVISKPGYYRLACDLVFNPTADAANAITVDSGVTDVNIDFANYTLSMSASSTKADNNGILIESDCENVVIHDGSIVGFSASSIRGYTGLNTIVVNDMILEGIPGNGGNRMIIETVASGVNFGPIIEDPTAIAPTPGTPVSNNIILTNLEINDFFVNNTDIVDQALWGIALFYCNDIEITGVQVSELTNNGSVVNLNGNTLGFGIDFCTNVLCRFCTGNDITSNSPDNPVAGGVVGDAAGAFYITCQRVQNYDCSYSNNVGTRRGGGLVWVGTSDFIAERCVADSNIVVDQTAAGVQSHFGFEAVGDFDPFDFCRRGVIKDCHVLNMPTAFIANGAIDVVFEDCEALAGNLVANSTILTEGFEAADADGVTFKNCIASGFTVPNPTNRGGIRIVAASTNINILGCKSTKGAIGIFVANGCTHVVADSNEVAFNTEFGIQDTTSPGITPNLYIRNVAFANPTNYSVPHGANASFAVVQLTQNAPYPLYTAPNASPLSNFDLEP